MSDQHFSHETWLSNLRNHLEEERYAPKTTRHCVATARLFLVYLEKEHIEIGATEPENVERYLLQERRRYYRRHGYPPGSKGWRCSHTEGIHMLLRLVHGQWPPVAEAVTPAEIFHKEICEAYGRWMISGGLAPRTISTRCREAGRFLGWLAGHASREALATLSLVDVDAYMKDRAGTLRRPSLKWVASYMRALLRWLHMTQQTNRDLSSTVIAPSFYAFESIPSAVRAEDVKKIMTLAKKDCTPKGMRDYAILMLLSIYGVRAGEVTALRLDDVDWRKEVIRIRHKKTGATSWLPLLPEVGEEILQYLQKSRPKTPFREMFIRCCAPYRPFKDGSSLYVLVRRRVDAAGSITTGKRGPHAFRHARAVSLLRAAVPVKEIGDLLGHRTARSTLVYLKLATEDLRAVALEIPKAVKA